MNSNTRFALFLAGALISFALVAGSDAAHADVTDEDGYVWADEAWADYKARGAHVEELVNSINIVLRAMIREGADPKYANGIRAGINQVIEEMKLVGQHEGVAGTINVLDCGIPGEDVIDLTGEDLGCITDSECEGLDADEERMFGNPYHPA